MKYLSIFIALFLSAGLTAQDLIADKAEALYANQKYEELIETLASDGKKYSARTNYIIGMAYYMLEDDENCIKHMDISINKDEDFADSHFMKGISLNYSGEHKKAIKSLEKAIELDSAAAEYRSALADAYYSTDEITEALELYTLATTMDNCPDRAFIMVPVIQLAEGNADTALTGFYTAKANVMLGTADYTTALYNIGLIEFLDSNYTEAEAALTELLMINPEDFESYVTLIQVYHATEQYDETPHLSAQLRKAYELNMLPETIGSQYFIDQFTVDSLDVIVYERFAQPEDELYYKYQFQVMHNGEFQFSVQLQRNVGDDDPERKYVLGIDRNGRNSSLQGWWGEEATYGTIRAVAITLIEDLL